MTKQQELDAIKELANKLDNNTYCGPWLREMIPFIESDMRSDFPIDVANLLKLREETIFLQKEIDQKRKEADEKIAKMYSNAKESVKQYRLALRCQIEESLQRLIHQTRNELVTF